MLVKHHGCYDMVIPSLDDSYSQMAKQFQNNSKVKVFFDDNTINMLNYLRGTK
jgi:hypothetical protein